MNEMKTSLTPLTLQHIEKLQSMINYEQLSLEDADLVSLINEFYINCTGVMFGNQLVGVCTGRNLTTSDDETIYHIDFLFIFPEFRAKGIGSHVLCLLKKSIKKGYISAHPFTFDAERFFLSNGFVADEEFYREDTNTVVFKVT
ncbi:GNAT family N-acetyltransferase [Brevibacillus sp. AG]|uniref:GNAT family N-acetyltransferase n=1 Tax=Brevibacillus sp. AG TaxID=3020891 RepID=UPI002330AB69|nr:GNAT family N-acetyltransferase [Brevibacillus sp. AG]MDC0764858.1 GNAT family N-acetyltransferase [Brevibacillus sp. AG]